MSTHASHPRPPAAPRSVLVLLGLAGAVVAVAGVRAVADLVGPILLGVTLVICVQPLHRWLLRRRLPGWLATVTSLVLLYALLIGLIATIGLSVARLVRLLPRYDDEFSELADQVTSGARDLGVSGDQVDAALGQITPGSVFGVVQDVLNGLSGTLSSAVLLVTVLVFMVGEGADFPRRLAVAGRSHPLFADALAGYASNVRRYWLVSTVFGLIVAVFDTVALVWLDIPLALLWGLIAFLTNYVPNIGFVIGVAPPALLGLLEGGPGRAIAVVVAYSVLNVVIQTLIQPRFTGDAVGLSSTLTFLSLILWAFVLGPLGALLAIPSSLLVKAVLVDADPSARWVDALISSRRDEPPPTRQGPVDAPPAPVRPHDEGVPTTDRGAAEKTSHE